MSETAPGQCIQDEPPDSETIERLAQLSPADYETVRKAEADALGWRVNILDGEVMKARRPDSGNGHDGGPGILFPEIEPWPTPVDGGALLHELMASASSYLALPTDAPALVSLWVLHAHAVKAFYFTPRLSIRSPTKRCGKTALLDWLQAVTPKSIRTESVTSAVIFRLIEEFEPVLLVDEVDRYIKRNDELIAAVNAGHRHGGCHLRCEGDDNKVRGFKTFAPVALAGIGKLPDTIADRSIEIMMERATKRQAAKIRPFRADRANPESDLCRKAARWAADNFGALKAHDPEIPDEMFNRQADNFRPIFAVADMAGDEWPQLARDVARRITNTADDEQDAGVMLLWDIRDLFMERHTDRLLGEDIAPALEKIEDRPWAEWGRSQRPISKGQVARLLRRFGIVSKATALADGRNKKGYTLDQFEPILERYPLDSPDSPSQNVKASKPSVGKGLSDNQNVKGGEALTFQNGPKAASSNSLDDLSFRERQTGGSGGSKANPAPESDRATAHKPIQDGAVEGNL